MVEGEGCFAWSGRSPQIVVSSTDLDVIEHCGRLFGRRVETLAPRPGGRKQQYATRIYGAGAVGWMMTLYPLLGERRCGKVREVLVAWRERPVHHNTAAALRRHAA